MWRELTALLFIPGELVLNLTVSLTLAFLLGLAIALLYRTTHRGLNYEQSFLTTMVLMAPIVTLVMLFIRGDLVLSLGLVGSLSIIRFRAPIKDTRDMVYLFWVIAIGLGCGTNNWTLVIISSILLAIAVTLLYMFEYGRPKHSDFVLVLGGQSAYPSHEAEEIIRRHTTVARVRSHEISEANWEIIFELRLTKNQEKTTASLLSEMKKIKGVTRVSILAPQLALPM